MGVTLLGDAAHLIPPGGEGVNIAMCDAMMLSKAIVKAYETAPQDAKLFQKAVDPLLEEAELKMAAQATEAGEGGVKLSEKMYGEDGAKGLMGFFQSFFPPEK